MRKALEITKRVMYSEDQTQAGSAALRETLAELSEYLFWHMQAKKPIELRYQDHRIEQDGVLGVECVVKIYTPDGL